MCALPLRKPNQAECIWHRFGYMLVCVRVCLQSESVLYLYLSFYALVRICQGFSLYELPTDIGASFVTMSTWGMHDFAMFGRCDCRQPLQRT